MEGVTKADNWFARFEKSLGFKSKIKWDFTIFLFLFHVLGAYWSYLYAFPAKWQTLVFAAVTTVLSLVGISCGVHRLWSHKSYKAKLPLKIFLMLCYSHTAQYSIYGWVRDHRLHHKYSDTAADPNDPSRGFWFAHVGCYLVKRNKHVVEKGKLLDMSDIKLDPVVAFETKYSVWLRLIFGMVLPTLTGIILWGESWQCAVAWQSIMRIITVFHAEMSINSFAHMYGDRPYNKKIMPTQNIITTFATLGADGGHNYHHTFPYDYKSAENIDFLNMSTMLIRLWAKMGLAYDLKEPSRDLLRAVIENQKLVQ